MGRRDAPPARRFPPETLLAAQCGALGARAAIFDVDGVLTDGRIYCDEQGERLKAFHSLDGHGIRMLMKAGIEPMIVSGRDSAALRRRVADLGVRCIAFGAAHKLDGATRLLDVAGLDWPVVAVIGNDWPDLPLMARSAFACAPCTAHPEVRARADHVTEARGGEGAAREYCDLLLMACGRYVDLLYGESATPDLA